VTESNIEEALFSLFSEHRHTSLRWYYPISYTESHSSTVPYFMWSATLVYHLSSFGQFEWDKCCSNLVALCLVGYQLQ